MPARDSYRPEAREAALEALDEALRVVVSAGPVLNGVPTDGYLGAAFAELELVRDEWAAVEPPDDRLELHNLAGSLDNLHYAVAQLARPFDAVVLGRLLDDAGVVAVELRRERRHATVGLTGIPR